jgi:rare lipoprotein A (peptidoglycan hydrolase)
MPFINGRFCMNPAFGRAVESARDNGAASHQYESQEQDQDSHWVTINGRRVLIHEGQGGREQDANQNKQNQRQQSPPQRSTKEFSGDATYYKLPGRKTASGDEFDSNKMAAAMTAEKVKLGETVTVAYSYEDERGNTVTRTISVVVNDRGPFARDADGKAKRPLQPAPERVIDLTPAAFMKLAGTTKPGHVPVTVTVPND